MDLRTREGQYLFPRTRARNEPIFDKLQSLDIPTKGTDSDVVQGRPYSDELTARIIRRAGELRDGWSVPRKKRPEGFTFPHDSVAVSEPKGR